MRLRKEEVKAKYPPAHIYYKPESKQLTVPILKWHLGHAVIGMAVVFALISFKLALWGLIYLDLHDVIVATALGSTLLGLLLESGIQGNIWAGGKETLDSVTDIWQYSFVWWVSLLYANCVLASLVVLVVWITVYLVTFYLGWTDP